VTHHFVDRFLQLSQERGPLCVGIDPSLEALQSWGLKTDVTGLRSFCGRLVEVAASRVAVVKPQSAFFERFGPKGMEELRRTVDAIHTGGALALIDAKRADISSTVQAYGEAFLGDDSPYRADAMTVVPYLGLGALQPVFDRAHRQRCGVFVVVRSSNPEASSPQAARLADGRTVALALAQEITQLQSASAVVWIGAVLGATLGPELDELASALSRSLLLCPGLGVQGATVESLKASLGRHGGRALPSVSREAYGTGPADAERAITAWAAQARTLGSTP